MGHSDKSAELQFWYLREHHFFNNLTRNQLKIVAMIPNFRSFKRGEVIHFEDNERIFLLKKGTIKIMQTDTDGNMVTKEIIQKGDLFGSFDWHVPSDEYAVIASDNILCCSFTKQNFEVMLESYPDVAFQYTKWLGLKFQKIKSRYADLMFKDVRTRFDIFLKEWAEKEGEVLGQDIILKNYLTHQDIASLICCTRQTVTQILAEYKEQGKIDYSRSFIKIFHSPSTLHP